MNSTSPPQEALDDTARLTRTLHEALQQLGYHRPLTEVAQDIPDARERLIYVGQLTEEAAHQVLAKVELGLPDCDGMAERGKEIAATLRQRAEGELSPTMCRAMMKQCADYAERAATFAQNQNALLNDIMMTQSFQDLSGQVIKKVVHIITRAEDQLRVVLVETTHQVATTAGHDAHWLDGPQVPDKALKQDDVDDLMASLGF